MWQGPIAPASSRPSTGWASPHLGSALKGHLRGLRRLRVGDHRVLYEVRDDELIVLVVRIAHRREVYRRVPE